MHRMFLLAVVVIALGIFVSRLAVPGRAFDRADWDDPAQVERGVRLRMADRLIAYQTLRGKTRAEVIRLLGEPPPTTYFSDWDLVYWLGPERSYLGMDSEWLVVRFGPDERAAECRIVRD